LAFATAQIRTYRQLYKASSAKAPQDVYLTIASQHEVLCVGQQRQLLAVRDIVLRAEGYCVIEAYSADEALRIFAATDVDIVVICHSIPVQSRRRLVLAMKQARPLTPVIALHEAYDYVTEADSSVDQLAGPEVLLEAVASLLKKPVQRVAADGQIRQAKPGL